MKVFKYILLLSILSLSDGYAQMVDNKIFRIIKNESYGSAVEYGEKKLKRLDDSDRYYRKAIPYHLGIGMVFRRMGNYSDAEKHYAEARRILIYKKRNDIRFKTVDYDVDDELAQMYIDIGNFYGAGELIKEGREAREDRFSKTNLLRYRSYLVSGNYFFKIGELDSAFRYYKSYIYYLKNSKHTSREELNRYADTYMVLTEMEIQKKDITQALVYAKKNKHLQFHKWTEMEAGNNNLNKVLSLNLLSECYRMLGDYKNATKFSDKAFERYQTLVGGDTYNKVQLLLNRANIYWDQKDYERAQSDFIYALEILSGFIDKNFKSLSEYEKENFYSSLKKNFDLLNSFALDKYLTNSNASDNLWTAIYDFQIRTKAILLNESNKMLKTIQASNDKDLMNQYNEWKKKKNELAKILVVEGLSENDPSVRDLRNSISTLEKSMSEKTFNFQDQSKQPTWKDIQDKLQPNEASVEVIRVKLYSDVQLNNSKIKKLEDARSFARMPGDSIAYVFLIVKPGIKTPEVVCIKNGNYLEDKSFKVFRNSQLYSIEDKTSYNTFWKPLKESLKGTNNVYFSSDGIYNLINLWILKNPTNGKYLIDEVNIINLTNTKEVLQLENRMNDIQSILLLGRPNYSKSDSVAGAPKYQENVRGVSGFFRNGLSDLPGTEKEVRMIGDYLQKKSIDTKVILWNEATEELIKNHNSPTILHIATHGFFESQETGKNPMLRSGLLFAGVTSGNKNPQQEDGLLTAYEASNLDLSNTKIVVLSACETGLGEIKNGEGVYGLQRAFEVAGVNTILMSMWKVNDETTQELMVNFYKELLTSPSVMEAFKKAQVKIRKQYPDPLYWGAFKLIGK